MTRAIGVIVVAALCAALLGVDSLSAAQDDAAREAARQQAMSDRVGKIDVGSVVEVERIDGTEVEGVLTAKTPDTITVDIYERRRFRRPRLVGTETIPIADVRDIDKPLSGAQVALITTGAIIGGCAAVVFLPGFGVATKSPRALPSIDSGPPPESGRTEPSIDDPGSAQP